MKHPTTPFPLPILLFGLVTLAAPSAHAIEYTTGFETDLGDWSAIKGNSLFHWQRISGPTPSGYTGPDSAYEGEYYLYLEASRNFPARTAYLQSPDLSAEHVLGLNFHYHLYGAHMGTLAVEVFDGSQWNMVWDVSGQQQTGHGAPCPLYNRTMPQRGRVI